MPWSRISNFDDGIAAWRKDYEEARQANRDRDSRESWVKSRNGDEIRENNATIKKAERELLVALEVFEAVIKTAEDARAKVKDAEDKLAKVSGAFRPEPPKVIGIKLGEPKTYTKDEIDKLLESITAKSNVKVTTITMPRAQQVAKPHGLRDRLRAAFRALFN